LEKTKAREREKEKNLCHLKHATVIESTSHIFMVNLSHTNTRRAAKEEERRKMERGKKKEK
jgi:hypothetical protein